MKIKILLFALLLISFNAIAQGDGPRTFLLAPKGIWGVNPKPTFLDQNFLPSGDILIKDADIKVNVYPTTLFHTFAIGKRFAQAMFMINPGSATGSAESDAANVPEVHASGFSDGFLGIKMGILGAPALSISDFTNHESAFSMNGYFRWWYSGTYDKSKPLNLGTNRSSFEIGFPMAVPLNKNKKRATWLEIYPSVRIYTPNTEPDLITLADKSHQLPLFLLENHLTHNFTEKFWAGVDLRFQYGGQLELDDVKQDNKINIIGGGITAGYQILPYLGASAGYGTIITGDNNAHSDMLRISIVFVYADVKK